MHAEGVWCCTGWREKPKLAATGGVVADRTRGVRPCVARRWESIKAENWAESSAGTSEKAFRSDDDNDVAMPDARRAASMANSATAQKYDFFIKFLSGCAMRGICL